MQVPSSSLTTGTQDLDSFVVVQQGNQDSYSASVGGRKSKESEELEIAEVTAVSSDELSSEVSLKGYEEDSEEESDEEEDSDDEEEEDEIEEFFAERARIRKDAAELKKLAGFYLHPEKAVVSDGTASASCFFDRKDDAVVYEGEEAMERARILADARALKKSAMTWKHPELPLEVDSAFVSARNYFHRYQGEEAVDREQAEERARILADAAALKKSAVDFMHPELPVATTDATVFGRNYFGRASADDQEDEEVDMDRDDVLEDVAELKRLAAMYRHPERPVATCGEVLGRNFFERPSADEQDENDDERDQILADMAALKKLAGHYMHPEKPLEVDATACARNYFTRPSAEDQVDEDDDEEYDIILKDMAALKKSVRAFRHPEDPVQVDGTACAHSYFSRPSAVEQEWCFEAEERARVLAECQALKKAAVDHLHPERPLEVDATACARNFFTTPSATMPEGFADMEERIRVLEEAKQLKKLATDYLHPEKPLDASACARNFFTRASADDQEEEEVDMERDDVLEDMAELKRLAGIYRHPERPLEVDATATARCYFDRASAPDQESLEDAKERARVLVEAAALAKLAENFLHPELPIQYDAHIQGRNYFHRHSSDADHNICSVAGEDEQHAKQTEEQEPYGHFDMDEDAMFADMRQSLVAPIGEGYVGPKFQSSKLSDDENEVLSRSPSSIMLFSGVDPESENLRLPSMTS